MSDDDESYKELVQWMSDLSTDCQKHTRVYSEDVMKLIQLVIRYLRDQGKSVNETINN